MPKDLALPDIITEACNPDHMMAVSFLKSSSPAFDMAMHFAKGASKFAESTIGKKPIYLAAFGGTKEQVARAVALLKIIGQWKGTQLFLDNGTATDAYRAIPVLECYLKSMAVGDHKAHCHWVYFDFKNDERDQFVIPCKMLRGQCEWILDERRMIQSNLPDRIHARAVDQGCGFCPNFRAGDLKPA